MGLKKIQKDSAPVTSMRGLFVIVKGQYSKTAPAVECRDGESRFIGGYDPANKDTTEWYQLMDRVTFETISCGSSLKQMTNRLTKTIVLFNNDMDAYLSHFNNTYEDDAGKVSRRVTVSPITRMMMEKVMDLYGDYYDDLIEEAEELAIKELANNKPKKTVKKTAEEVPSKSKKPLKKSKPNKSVACTKEVLKTDEDEVVIFDEPPKKKVVKKKPVPKKDSGKKLPLFKSI